MTDASPKKIVLIAPFWYQINHVGILRVERFRRWLNDADVQIVLVTAGKSGIFSHEWGHEIRVPNPLIRNDRPTIDSAPKTRPRSRRRRLLSSLKALAVSTVLSPDPGVVWARRAAGNDQVLAYAVGADLVISTSPPESAHVAATGLARRLGAEVIIDMRDGWLDEPLKPLLNTSRVLRWRERRLEARILSRAKHILVTSEIWRDLLAKRYPAYAGKCTVLTNAMPFSISALHYSASPETSKKALTLRYTGRFGGSHLQRQVDDMMRPLMEIQRHGPGRIEFVGAFSDTENERISAYAGAFRSTNWDVLTVQPQPQKRVLELQSQASGLLLLSASHSAIPAKLFEYFATGRPILAISAPGSAVWQLGEHIDQVFNYPLGQGQPDIVDEFLAACKSSRRYRPPDQFSDAYCRQIFLRTLSISPASSDQHHPQ